MSGELHARALRTSAAVPGFAPPIVHKVLRSPGQPLSASARATFEPVFGRDLSDVRLHADARAAESARAVGATAYTVGSHVVLGVGQERALLAHELTHVVQQSAPGAVPPPSLRIADGSDAAEAEAGAISRQLDRTTPTPVRVQARTGLQLSRQAASSPTRATASTARRIQASAASVSWIDQGSPAGAHVPDPTPPATLTVPFVTGSSGFRFSNYLHGWCETSDAIHLTAHGLEADSGIYRGPSYLGIPSHAYPTRSSRAPFTEGGIEGIEFEQLAGARTISAGAIGGGIGAAVGVAGGAWLGAKGGALIGALGGPIGAGAGAIIGGVIGGLAGWGLGSLAANRITNFPPIWTRIRLRLKATGARTCELVAHSPFPSNNLYCDLSQVRTYSALAPEQSRWEAGGWEAGNPWGASRPSVTP